MSSASQRRMDGIYGYSATDSYGDPVYYSLLKFRHLQAPDSESAFYIGQEAGWTVRIRPHTAEKKKLQSLKETEPIFLGCPARSKSQCRSQRPCHVRCVVCRSAVYCRDIERLGCSASSGIKLHVCGDLLGVLAELRTAAISFLISICTSPWNDSSSTGRIFMKFDISASFENMLRKLKFHLNLT